MSSDEHGGGLQTSEAPAGRSRPQSLDDLCITTIRTLSIDAVQKANSGHPGAPMALAPAAYTLWREFLRYDPDHPHWPNRDRFVLSNGHASMLLYSLIYLAGIREVDEESRPTRRPALELDDLRAFRQLGSKCPGHPERGLTTGVETTTGPLGQGCGNSVGMAMGSKWLAATYNRPDFKLFDFDVYTFCGDGDMMEGVSSEAASLAAHLELDNLCWIYDSNRITIEGHTDLAFSEDVERRFLAYGWDVKRVGDANDTERFAEALKRRPKDGGPRLIILESRIGWGAPHKENTREAHGEALGEEEVRLTKRRYGWPEEEKFRVPDGVVAHFQEQFKGRGGALREAWDALFEAYRKAYPKEGAELAAMFAHETPKDFDAAFPSFAADPAGVATRDSSGKVLNAVAKHYPWMIGGSADLAPSTKTNLTFEGAASFSSENYGGRNLHFGIREHAMGAILNGLGLCDIRAYGSGFLIFSDYMRPPIRLAALMDLPVIFIFTHDSIGVGEDGPTHQPVEQLVSLRAVPGLIVLRPADANEVLAAWRLIAGLRRQPACLVLSRQKLPTLDRSVYADAGGLARGAYVLADADPHKVEVILIATGSEVGLCVKVFEDLKKDGVAARLVSMPSWELFERQDAAYKESVLPKAVKARVSVEAGAEIGWNRYVGAEGRIIGMTTVGASAPIGELMEKFGFTPEKVREAVDEQLKKVSETRS